MTAVRIEDVQPGDRVDGEVVVAVFPGAPHRYATLVLGNRTLRHYRPQTLIDVERREGACICGPGPVGSAGWSPDCPVHNVRQLLQAPSGFDPDTVAERVAAFFEDHNCTDWRA